MSKYTSNTPTTRPPADPQAAKRAAGKQHRTIEQLVQKCLAKAGNNPERAIALARLREIYLAQIKKANSDYFDRVKRAVTAANGSGK